MNTVNIPSTSVFRHKPFAWFWASRFILNLAVQVESVAIGWQVYQLARLTRSVEQSAFLVGMVGLAQFLPLLALTLVAGAAADRFDRKKTVLICLLIETACVALLAIISRQAAPSLTWIFAIAAVFGAARAFMTPASSAMGPMLVPRDELPRSIAWNSMAWQGASVIGPFVGGMLLLGSASLAFSATAVMYAVAAVCALFITVDTRPTGTFASGLHAVKEGLAFVWSNKVVFGSISLDLFAVLLGGATALLPVYARDVLHVGSTGFGILRAAPSAGAVATALWFASRPLERQAGLWMFSGVALFGVATIVFALSNSMALSVIALVVLGAGDMLSVNVRQTLVQMITPDHMRGRVSAVSYLFIGASNELGEFESGVVARLLGPVGAALFGGIGCLAVTGLWAWMFPQLRNADRLDEAP